MELISRAATGSDTAGGREPSVSANGRHVVFTSPGANLVADQVDAGGTVDVFLHDRITGVTTLVSHRAGSPVTAGNGNASSPVISADSRYVAFVSDATDLVADQVDDAGTSDIFLHDRVTGVTLLVSRTAGSPVTAGNRVSFTPRISANGQVVAYVSLARNLVAGQVDANGADDSDDFGTDVFLYDRVTGATTLVSRAVASAVTTGDGASTLGDMSADGRYIAFQSQASDLVPGQEDDPGTVDVFLYDRVLETTVLVSRTTDSSVTASTRARSPVLSADGRFVAFTSLSANLVVGQSDLGQDDDVFLYDRLSGDMTLVSRKAGSPTIGGNGSSLSPAISADGAWLAFLSSATDLVTGQSDVNAQSDVFLYDRLGSTTILVSGAGGSPTTTANGAAEHVVLSTDGTRLAFTSRATDLVAGQVDANGSTDVFRYDRLTGTTVLVSRTPGSPVTTGNGGLGFSSVPAISADGQTIVYATPASDLVAGLADLNGTFDAFLHDEPGGTTVLSRRDPGRPGASGSGRLTSPSSVSADGRHVLFTSQAENLVPGQGDTNHDDDVFLHDRVTGATALVSRAGASPATAGNGPSSFAVLSADGRYVAFSSFATDLMSGQQDINDSVDVFLHERETGTTTLVSRRADSATTAGDRFSFNPAISADGRFVAFRSSATDLVADQVDSGTSSDVFLYDRVTGSMTLVSRAAGSAAEATGQANGSPGVSADGRFVAFESGAFNLVADLVGHGFSDVFLYDRVTGAMTLVSGAGGSATVTGNDRSEFPIISADGRFVAFQSLATDLVPDQADTNGESDVFLYDRVAGSLTLVSRTAAAALTTAAGPSEILALSADGGVVAFRSSAPDLVVGQEEAGPRLDLFVYDRVAGVTTLVSRPATSDVVAGVVSAEDGALSADGRFVAFSSPVPDLVPGQVDLNEALDVFLHDRVTGATTLVSRARLSRVPGPAVLTSNGISGRPVLSSDGTVIAFVGTASNLTGDDDLNGMEDVFVLDRRCPDAPGPRSPARSCPGAASRPD
jgi:Tol biopolymer transport system component